MLISRSLKLSADLVRAFNLHLVVTSARSTTGAAISLTSHARRMSSAAKPKIYVSRRVHGVGVDILKERGCDVRQWDSDEPVARDELLKQVAGVDALFCLLTEKIDKEVLDAAGPNLKVVATMSVGFDHIDLAECKRRQIPVGYTPNVLTDATAELTVSLLLATDRRIPEAVNAVKDGEWGTWKPMWMCGRGLNGSTVGVAGFGRIGFAVAQRLLPFGVSRVLYADQFTRDDEAQVKATRVDIDTLLKESDFVIACTALTPETKGMFNKSAFEKMKDSAIFINTSRGGILNQEDLVWALKNGVIRAAGLDVTIPEPLPVDHDLLKLKNAVILPHIGSATDATRSKMSELTGQNILAVLDKKSMPAQVPSNL